MIKGQFKQLTPEEEVEFRKWARETYTCGDHIWGVWHPVIQDECVRINCEKSNYAMDYHLSEPEE